MRYDGKRRSDNAQKIGVEDILGLLYLAFLRNSDGDVEVSDADRQVQTFIAPDNFINYLVDGQMCNRLAIFGHDPNPRTGVLVSIRNERYYQFESKSLSNQYGHRK